jgi:hypothetical protein
MYDSVAPTRYPNASVAAIYNGRIQPDGTVRRRSGTIKTSSAVPNAGTGYGAVKFTTAAGTDQIVVFCGTKAYKSENEGSTWSEIATGLRQDYYDFATFRQGATNYLLCANGDTTVKEWDGTSWGTVTNAPSGVTYIAVFNGRVWYAGHSGVILQATKIADRTVIASPDGLTVQVLTHSGDVPTGLYQVGPHLLVFDRSATSYVDGYGEQTLIVAQGATGFSRSVGCVGFRTIVGVGDNGVCWLSERGVEYYVPGMGIRLISRRVQEFMGTIDWEELYANPGRMSAAYDSIDQDYLLALSTTGTRNNRILVLNLRQANVLDEDERSMGLSAASVDRLQSPDSGDVLFAGDADGYLIEDAGGAEAKADANGFMSLAGSSESGDPISEDADGYLEVVTNDTLPASLFIAPVSGRPSTVYSVGYDGWVRRHYDVDNDDMASDETGGTAVTLSMIGKPGGQQKRAANLLKRVRTIHLGSIQEDAATISVRLRGKGTTTGTEDVTMSALGVDHAEHERVKTKFDAYAPQVEVQTSDDVRISLLGMSYELLRERR